MSKKEKKKIDDEQKKEQAKNTSLMSSISIGLLLSYFFGYAASFNMPVLEGAKMAFKMIKEHKIFYFPTFDSVIGWLVGIICGFFIWIFLRADSQKHFTTDMETSAGSGGFMSKAEFDEYKSKYIGKDPEPIKDVPVEVESNYEDEAKKYSANMIMTNEFCRPINSRALIGNNNILVVGGAGTGKSRFFIKPNLLQMNASYVITDPSGEMINSVGKPLVEHGYKIKVFNISDMKHSNTYNPLEYIRDEAGVNMVISCLIDNTTKGEGGGDNQFFVDAEKLLYSACIFYLKDFSNDKNKKNFAGVMSLINSSAVDENNTNAKSELDKLFDKLPKSSLAWKYYKSFKQAAGKTLKSIIISCTTRLQPFLTPQVINLTRSDNLELEKIGDEKTALFIITPQADRTYAFLASMLYSQLFETLYYKGEQQLASGGSEQMKIPVRCMMDEFANIGTVPEFPSKLSTMRKYNISASVVLQDIAQIEAMYKDNWKTLVGNCSSILFLGSPEPNTQKYFSEMLGKKTVRTKSTGESKGKSSSSSSNYQYTSREVMTADELGRLPSDECIIFTQNMRPYRDKKYKYENHPYFFATADADHDNAFEYKKYSVFDNSRNGRFKSLIAAQVAAAKYRENKNKVKSTKAEKKINADPNLAANDIELSKEQETKLLSVLMLKAEQALFDKYEEEMPVIKIEGDMPSKYLFNIANGVYHSTKKDCFIIFGGVKNKKGIIPGVGYAVPDKFEKLKKAMNNGIGLTEPKQEDGFKNCLITAVTVNTIEKYTDYIKKYCA